MADSKGDRKVRRKSARVALNTSFSKFKNTEKDPLIVDASIDSETEKAISDPKTDVVGQHNSDDDFVTPHPKKMKLTEEAQIEDTAKAQCPPKKDLKPKPTDVKKSKNSHGKLVVVKAGQKLKVGDGKDRVFRTRTSPNTLFLAIKSLSKEQLECVREMGFGSLLSLNIDTIPSKLGRFIVKHYDAGKNVLMFRNGTIPISKEVIHDVTGIPMGCVDISDNDLAQTNKEMEDLFRSQYEKVKVRPNHIVQQISSSAMADLKFKLNFIVLFASIMGRCYTNGDCYFKFLKKIDSNTIFGDIDWAGYIIESLKSSRAEWKPDGRHFCGPLTVLVLIYVDRVACRTMTVTRDRRAIEVWTTEKLKGRESEELECGGFGMGEILDRVELLEAGNQEQAYLTVDPNVRESTAAFEKPTDVKDLLLKLRSYMKMIRDGQAGFQQTMLIAKKSFAEYVEIQDLEREFTSIMSQSNRKDNQQSSVNVVDSECDRSHGLQKGEVLDEGLQIVVTPPDNIKQSNWSKLPECVDDLSASQFWVHPDIIPHIDSAFKQFENVGSAFSKRAKGLRASGFHVHTDDVPSFSLGLTQEVETNLEEGEVTVFKGQVEGEEPCSALPISAIKPKDHGKDVKGKEPGNLKKPPPYLCSPFLRREVDPMSGNCNEEQMVADWIFAMQGDKWDFVFSTKYGLDVPKQIFESFVPNEFLFVNVIDVWAKILSNEERFRNRFSPVRLFCPTLTETLLTGQKTYEMFKEDIAVGAMFNKELTDLKEVDFIFFPLQRSNHIFLMVFNLKNPRWIILDNIACDDAWKSKDLSTRYGCLPDKVRLYLRRYMSDVKHPKCKNLMKTAARRPKMNCQTTWNGIDCGVFVMRHMEAFKGGDESKWDCGLLAESDEQTVQLNRLRLKYLTKILLSDENLLKDDVLYNALEFRKQPLAERERIKDEAFRTRIDRLS